MHHFRIILSAFIFSLTSLSAVLPPLYNSLEEVNTLLKDPELSNHLSSADVILSISRTDQEGGWEIQGNKNTVHAKVVPLPQSIPGPTKYKVIWQ